MAVYLRIIYLLTGLTGVHGITTVSKVPVTAGKSVSIPCLYDSQYVNHVKYLCVGYYWNHCSYAVNTNEQHRSGKYSIFDDKKQQIFTVTINQLTSKNTDYWCVVEIKGGSDHGVYFKLSVASGTPSLYVDHQQIVGYIGENITIRCHHSNSGGMKWCRLGRNCVTGSSGSINGTTVTTHREPNVFTVTMSGLKPQDSGWYWCAKGDIQIPVHLTVTEKPITTTAHALTGTTATLEKEQRTSFGPKILIIPLSVLILIVIVVLFIWFKLRHKQSKAEPSATAMPEEEVTYSEVRPKKKRSAKVDEEVTYSNVGNMRQTSEGEEKGTEVTYSTLANHHRNI